MIFRFPGALLRFVDYRREIQFEDSTVEAAVASLIGRHPMLEPVLLDGSGRIRTVHRLFLNGEQFDHGAHRGSLGEGDCIEIVTALAGG
ncbi:MoaD/ThiS family protein [Pendulispora albinea]|uniref:MoaD/ThiS family protein n=1 Tax=Pendulispora albinea TaxID=2741071 RepID=A0ABZ2LQH7_9BACT